jgi:hypothetical protein
MSYLKPEELVVLERLRGTPENEEVLGHPVFDWRRTEIHDGLFSELSSAMSGLPDVHRYDPKGVYYRGDSGVIFAGADGMLTISFRLPLERVNEAIANGGSASPNRGWVIFEPFAVDGLDRAGSPRGQFKIPLETMRERLRLWCAVAHAAAGLPTPSR